MTAPARTALNPWADAGRARKVLRLTLALDGAFDMMGCDPFSACALEHVLAMDFKAWGVAAKHAKVPLASITTQGMVADVYRQRVEVRGNLSRLTAPLPRVGGTR